MGETGTVRIGGMAVNEIQEWNFADERDYDEQVKTANYEPRRCTVSGIRCIIGMLSMSCAAKPSLLSMGEKA